VPVVVVEIALGVLAGPHVLGLATVNKEVTTFADLGLAFLMFLVGYEIRLDRIRGRPLALATAGWLCSLALALLLGAVLALDGIIIDRVIVGLALTSTALGTIMPTLSDTGVAATRFGDYVIAAGTLGEFGPLVAIAVLLTVGSPLDTVLLLAVFIVVAVGAALLAARRHPPRMVLFLRRNLHSSAQLPVRMAVMLIVVLVYLATRLGLSALIGAFAAGVVVRLFSAGDDARVVQVKLEAIGYGLLVPIFFIVSGMDFDLGALVSGPANLARMGLFVVLFVAVRGIPAVTLYVRDLNRTERSGLALFSATALPLVVVIANLGVATHRMHPVTAAALVGAAIVSVLVFPSGGLALARRAGDLAPLHDLSDTVADEA
jgi:Kef-type K+ transport system membrane component KefB